MPYIDNKVQKHYNLLYKRIIMNRSKSAVFGSEITLQIKAIKRLPFIFQASEPTEKPFENCTKHFLLPLYSIVWDYNSKQKGNINTVWSKILCFGSKRVKMCLRLYVMMINT